MMMMMDDLIKWGHCGCEWNWMWRRMLLCCGEFFWKKFAVTFLIVAVWCFSGRESAGTCVWLVVSLSLCFSLLCARRDDLVGLCLIRDGWCWLCWCWCCALSTAFADLFALLYCLKIIRMVMVMMWWLMMMTMMKWIGLRLILSALPISLFKLPFLFLFWI